MQDNRLNKVSGILNDKPGKIEHYEKRFGLIAIEKGFICADDLVKALIIQVDEDIHYVPHRLLGDILCDQGIMTEKQVEEVVSELFHRIKATE